MDGLPARWCMTLINVILFLLVLDVILWLLWLAGGEPVC